MTLCSIPALRMSLKAGGVGGSLPSHFIQKEWTWMNTVHEEVTYTNLVNYNSLERCLGGNTQNNREWLNLIIQLAPILMHLFAKINEIASCLVSCIFNDGFLLILWY